MTAEAEQYPFIVREPGLGAASLAALLQAQYGVAGWKAYQEDMEFTNLSVPTVSASGTIPGGGTNLYNGSTQYSYAAKHDGTLFFPATNGGTVNGPGPTDSTNTEAGFYASFGQLATDLASNSVAKYNLITPDLYNDMHSGLPGSFTYNGIGGGVTYPNTKVASYPAAKPYPAATPDTEEIVISDSRGLC